MGTLSVDDVTGEMSWEFSDIGEPSSMHIHIGASGVGGGGLIGLGVATSGGPGTLIVSVMADPAAVSQITANPFASTSTSTPKPFLSTPRDEGPCASRRPVAAIGNGPAPGSPHG